MYSAKGNTESKIKLIDIWEEFSSNRLLWDWMKVLQDSDAWTMRSHVFFSVLCLVPCSPSFHSKSTQSPSGIHLLLSPALTHVLSCSTSWTESDQDPLLNIAHGQVIKGQTKHRYKRKPNKHFAGNPNFTISRHPFLNNKLFKENSLPYTYVYI